MIARILACGIRLVTGVQKCPPDAFEESEHIFIANHASHFDFLVIWATLPHHVRKHTRPVAAHDYWSKGLVKPWLARSVFRAILVKRKGRNEDGSHPLVPIHDALSDGDSIIIFPEGTRSEDGQMKAFKPGVYDLASKNPSAKVVPVALDNLTRILPKGEFLPLPIIGRAYFMDPTQLEEGEDKKEFLHRLSETIAKELNQDD